MRGVLTSVRYCKYIYLFITFILFRLTFILFQVIKMFLILVLVNTNPVADNGHG